MQKYFEVGQIVNTFGINGTVKVKPFTDEIERFEELKNVLIDKNNKLIKCEIENVKYQKQMVLLKFKGLDNINQVEQYKGCYLKNRKKICKKIARGNIFYSRFNRAKCIYRGWQTSRIFGRHIQCRK